MFTFVNELPYPLKKKHQAIKSCFQHANLQWHQALHPRRTQLPMPCPLCKAMHWFLRPPGKMGKQAASAIEPSLEDRRGMTDCVETAASADSSSMPLLRKLQTHHHLQYRPSNLQQLPHPMLSLLLRSNERRCYCRPRKRQLDLQTLYSGSAITPSGIVVDQQVLPWTSQPSQPVSSPHPPISAVGLPYIFKCLLFVWQKTECHTRLPGLTQHPFL